ncbi:hypothetical protein Dimus_010613, partial [Dionaea muscipula]
PSRVGEVIVGRKGCPKGRPKGRPRKKGVGVVGGSPDGARLLLKTGGRGSPTLGDSVVRCEREVIQREQLVKGLGDSSQRLASKVIQVYGRLTGSRIVRLFVLRRGLAAPGALWVVNVMRWGHKSENCHAPKQHRKVWRVVQKELAIPSTVESPDSQGVVVNQPDHGGATTAVELAKSGKVVGTAQASRDAQGWQMAKGKPGQSRVHEVETFVVAESRFSPLADESRGSGGDLRLIEGLGGVLIPGAGAIT